MHAKCEVFISYSSKVTAKVKVDNRQDKTLCPIIQSGGIEIMQKNMRVYCRMLRKIKSWSVRFFLNFIF